MPDLTEKLESGNVKEICRGHIYGLEIKPKCKFCRQDENNKFCEFYIPQKVWIYKEFRGKI
jgi:hypothetical protein